MNINRRLLAFAMLAGLALQGGALHGQAPIGTNPNKIYTRKTAFKLPFNILEKDRGSLRAVQLYVKAGPTGVWAQRESVSPQHGEFTYRVSEDGEYWFSVVTLDKNGKMTPADVTKELPGLVVVVDTKPPEVDLVPVKLGSETWLQCKIQDANPDYDRTKLETLTNRAWHVVESSADQQGLFRVSREVLSGPVRATVFDKAGNSASREFSHLQTDTPPNRMENSISRLANEAPSRKSPVQPVTYTVPADQASCQIINNTHAFLDYQIDDIDPKNVGKVEIWVTRDEGQTWQFLCEDKNRHSPVEIDLPGEGLFGLSLAVVDANGVGSNAPAKGEAPNWWVEVDLTKPAAQLISVRLEEPNVAVITWSASDKNAKPEPIDLYYSTHRDGAWQLLAKDLKNTGSYRWSMPKDLGREIFVRMDVTDKAGNMTRCEIVQPVVLEQQKPRIRVMGVTSSSPHVVSPMEK